MTARKKGFKVHTERVQIVTFKFTLIQQKEINSYGMNKSNPLKTGINYTHFGTKSTPSNRFHNP